MPMPIAMEMIEQPLYDTMDLRRMGERVSLFSICCGQQAGSIWREPEPKGYGDTNVYQCGQLDAPKEFIVRDISVLLYDQHGPLPVFDRSGMGNIWAKTYLEFMIMQKLYWQGPLMMVADPICQLGGLEALQKTHEIGTYQALRLLNRQHENPMDVMIRSQQMFNVIVTPFTPVCRQITVRVVLNGKLYRPVI